MLLRTAEYIAVAAAAVAAVAAYWTFRTSENASKAILNV